MYDLFFGNGASWFTIPAIIGTTFFLFRMILLMAGAGHDLGLDVHIGDLHVGDVGHTDAHHTDSTHSFEILSIQSIAAFVMGFGWAGLAGLKGTHWHLGTVIVVAAACGVGMVWLLALLLRGMVELQTSGNIAIASTVGREGDVYVTVPGDGRRGQVRVTVDDRQRIYDATSQGESLASGTRIRVLRANDDNTLTVAKA
jgi:membrane protein implicated in regulation of membrane protease activity